MSENISAITIKEFAEKLTAGGGEYPSPADCVEYGIRHGWLEPQDDACREQFLLRKHAARIIHNFLRLELKEADDIDGSPAYVLRDLFDCRVCAGHIIQVYVKGIMEGVVLPDGMQFFDADAEVSKEEAERLLQRVFNKTLRHTKQSEQEGALREVRKIPVTEALALYGSEKGALLVDVRTRREYEEKTFDRCCEFTIAGHDKKSIRSKYAAGGVYFLYCNEGEQSAAAARCLMEAGYTNTVCFAWKRGKVDSV